MPAPKHGEINQDKVAEYWSDFPARWGSITAHAQHEDGLWLISHASYLIRTGFLWAVDLAVREPQAEAWLPSHAAPALQGLRFVLFTHAHSDHYCEEQLLSLRSTGVQVVLPDFFPADMEEKLAPLQVIRVKPGDVLHLENACIRVLPGHHYDYNRPEMGVPAVGYHVTAAGKTLLFPGDVRNYGQSQLPTGADMLLAHVWLGRGCAEQPKEETCLSAFCEWLRRAKPRHVLLAHLYDVKRKAKDQWTEAHAHWVMDELADCPFDVSAPAIGERIDIR